MPIFTRGKVNAFLCGHVRYVLLLIGVAHRHGVIGPQLAAFGGQRHDFLRLGRWHGLLIAGNISAVIVASCIGCSGVARTGAPRQRNGALLILASLFTSCTRIAWLRGLHRFAFSRFVVVLGLNGQLCVTDSSTPVVKRSTRTHFNTSKRDSSSWDFGSIHFKNKLTSR